MTDPIPMMDALAIPTEHPVFNSAALLNAKDTCKAVVFRMAQYNFALPVLAVQKVIRLTPNVATVVTQDGFVLLDGHPITVIDVRAKLGPPNPLSVQTITIDTNNHRFPSPDHNPPSVPTVTPPIPCLLIMHAKAGGRWALRADSLPELIDLPFASIYPISSTHPQPISTMAQFMAILASHPSHRIGGPIFLLNLAPIQPTVQEAAISPVKP